MLKKVLLICLLVNSCFLSFVSCDSKSKEIIVSSENLKVIQVASVCPLSGELEVGGKSLKNGAQLAIENKVDVFKKLGFDLKFLPFDDKADPDVGADVAKKLINNKNVLAVMGHYNSGVTLKAAKIYNEKDLAMISPASTAVEITEKKYKNVNRIVARDDVQGAVAAGFSFNDLKSKRAFLINDGTPYGKGITSEFKKAYTKLGGVITNLYSIKQGQEDFSNEINMLKSDKADVLYFGGMYPEGAKIIQQMHNANVTAKFVGSDGVDSPEIIKNANSAAIGTYYTTTAGDINDTNVGKVWLARYENKFNLTPDSYTIYGYDAMDVILNAILNLVMKNSDKVPTRKEVVDYIRKTKKFKGLSSNVTFNNKGDNTEAQVFIYKYDELKYPANLVRKVKINEIK